MSRPMPTFIKLLATAVLVVAVGCAEKNKPIGGPEQPARGAADRIAELQDQLALAQKDRTADQERILQLQNELDKCRNQQAGPAEGWSSVPGGAMTAIEGTLLFDSGKAVLKHSGQGLVDRLASEISSKFGDRDIYVFGHTDNEPIKHSAWKDNYELSCQRALTMIRALRSRGVTARLAACGWGEYRPVADNSTAKTRQANRRVEVFAMTRQIEGSASTAVRKAQ